MRALPAALKGSPRSLSQMLGDPEQAVVPLGVAYNPHKAGLNARPVEEVNRIVAEASRGGRFYQDAEKKQALLSQKIEKLRAEIARAPSSSAAADAIAEAIEAERGDMKRLYVCVDFDAFFSAVAELDDPSLVGRPHAVGGGMNSVLSTSSYKAREYGVRSAMPIFVAKRLCPELIVVPSNFARYSELSKLATEKVFSKYAGNYFESRSLDECIFEISSFCEKHAVSPEQAVEQMRAEVTQVTGGLTVSAGIGCTQMLAKISADFNKPNGSYFVPCSREDVIAFCNSLPIRKIPGIGKVTESYLTRAFGIEKLGEVLLPHNRAALHFVLSDTMYRFLVASALGVSKWAEGYGGASRGRKSVSRERTFRPTSDVKALRNVVVELCQCVADDISSLKEIDGGRGVTLKIKTSAFAVRTRSRKSSNVIASAEDIQSVALEALEKLLPFEGRLLGIRIHDLVGPSVESANTRLDPGQSRLELFFGGGASSETRAVDSPDCSKEEQYEQPTDGSFCEDTIDVPPCPDSPGDVTKIEVKEGSPSRMICPICNASSYVDLGRLNLHIDSCLTEASGFLPKARSDSRSDDSRKRNPRKKQRQMDSFLG